MSGLGVLNFTIDLCAPSHLWMRRMLDALGNDVALVIADREPTREYRDRFRCEVVPRDMAWYARRIERRLGLRKEVPVSRRAARWFARHIASPQVRVVLVHFLTKAIVYERVWRATDKPVWVHCHGQDVTWNLSSAGRLVHPADYAKRVRGLPANVRFIANSQSTRTKLLEIGIAPERIRVKYLGVPVADAAPRHACRKEAVNVLFLGRLIDAKGPDLVIRAFDLACRRGFAGRLLVAGDGVERAACERERANSRFAARMELLGTVSSDQGEQLRSEADIFTAHNRLGPSSGQEEAFGVSYVEAMAAALPVVTGRSGGLTEVIEHGKQGILFEPGDVEAHAESLLRLAQDPELRLQMGLNGWQRARQHFSLQRETSELRQILALPLQQPFDSA